MACPVWLGVVYGVVVYEFNHNHEKKNKLQWAVWKYDSKYYGDKVTRFGDTGHVTLTIENVPWIIWHSVSTVLKIGIFQPIIQV